MSDEKPYPFIPQWRVDDDWEQDCWELGWRVACWLREDPVDVLFVLPVVG